MRDKMVKSRKPKGTKVSWEKVSKRTSTESSDTSLLLFLEYQKTVFHAKEQTPLFKLLHKLAEPGIWRMSLISINELKRRN